MAALVAWSRSVGRGRNGDHIKTRRHYGWKYAAAADRGWLRQHHGFDAAELQLRHGKCFELPAR